MSVRMFTGDCRAIMAELPDASVQCCVTSPPYYQLRDYKTAGQIGLEDRVEDYVETLVTVFREARRVLRNDGTLWLNLASSYAAGGNGTRDPVRWPKQSRNNNGDRAEHGKKHPGGGFKPKDLIPIPWLVGLALQQDGWWLRRDHIWHKPNCMPESATDRATSAHEYVLMFSKAPRYFYDGESVKERLTSPIHAPGNIDPGKIQGTPEHQGGNSQFRDAKDRAWGSEAGRNMRSVWTIPTASYSEAHFATFPPALAERCIKAGTSEKGACGACGAPWVRVVEREELRDWRDEPIKAKGIAGELNGSGGNKKGQSMTHVGGRGVNHSIGWQPTCVCNAPIAPCVVLDPFGGAGTVSLVAERLGRDSIYIDLSPEYTDMAERRVMRDAPMFTTVERG